VKIFKKVLRRGALLFIVLLAVDPNFAWAIATLIAQENSVELPAEQRTSLSQDDQESSSKGPSHAGSSSKDAPEAALQPLDSIYKNVDLQFVKFKDFVAQFDASLAEVNQVFSAILFYDFGTSKLAAFTPTKITSQFAVDHFQNFDISKEDGAKDFESQIQSAFNDFSSNHPTAPSNLDEAMAALTNAGLALPPAPLGMAYAFSADEQALMLEPRAKGIPFIVAWLVLGSLLLTLRTKLINVRGVFHALALACGKYADSSLLGEISNVRAFYTSLASSVGLGAISSVAIAVGIGGPGAAFWIMVCCILAMATKFTECSLSQCYRNVNQNGTVLGGPMRYMHLGFKFKRVLGCSMVPLGKFLGFCFAIICVCVALFVGSAFQVSQSLAGLQTVRGLERLVSEPWIYGAVMAGLVSLVVFGSIRWLARVAMLLTPLMLLIFAAACLSIIGANWSEAEIAFRAIFAEAFEPQAAIAGGLLGVMLVGLSHFSMSTDAGLGTAAIVHSAARCDEPTREGILAMLEPLIVGVVFGLLTAMTIGVSGVATSSEGQELIASGKGTALLLSAFSTAIPEWLVYILHAAFFLFAFTTCITWGYFGERCIVHLLGPFSSVPFKVVFVLFTFLGSILTATNLMTFSHLLLLTLAIPNMIALFLLHGIVVEELDDYSARLRAGKMKRKKPGAGRIAS